MLTEREISLPAFELDSYRDKTYLTHAIHPYPAKFVPQIPRTLIAQLSNPGDLVLDPFCGSGTTVLEAMLLKRVAVGTDLNDLAVRIARAKTLVLKPTDVEKLSQLIHQALRLSFEPNTRPQLSDAPDFKNRAHWFTDESVRDLAQLRSFIAGVEVTPLRNYLEVCLSAVIVRASRQENDTNWRAVNRPYDSGDAHRYFAKKALDNLARSKELSLQASNRAADVIKMDARDLKFAAGSVDLVVTSPPYANSYDYYLYHKLRLFWLGIDHYSIQAAEIGSRNKHSDQKVPATTFALEMAVVFQRLHNALKRKGLCALVVGDSIVQGEFLDMFHVYRDIATDTGFKVIDRFSFDQRKYSKAFTVNQQRRHKKTHIILFQKT